MENTIENSIAEVLDILNHTKKSITDKIPKKFMDFLTQNASKEYKSYIDYENKDWINNLSNETIELLSIIYRDYLVDTEERKILINEEQIEITRLEKERNEKYSYDNIFKNRTIPNISVEKNNISQNLIVTSEKTNWYNKIINKLKQLFVK